MNTFHAGSPAQVGIIDEREGLSQVGMTPTT
jgi:hypothetical protein